MSASRMACRAASCAGVFWASLSCDSSTRPEQSPQGGALAVLLSTPNADDGAVYFTVGGGPIDSVTRSAESTVQTIAVNGDITKVLVHGSVAGGTIAKLWVPDVRVTYHVTLQQVARRGTYQQRPVIGYSLSIARP